MKVTTDDLLEALHAAMARPADGGGATVTDLAVATGYSKEKIREALLRLHGEGRLEVQIIKRIAIHGRPIGVPTYRIKPQ